jgi:hypothetical protein
VNSDQLSVNSPSTSSGQVTSEDGPPTSGLRSSFASADAKAMAGQVDPASSPQEENVEVPKLDLGELSRVEASPTLCGRDARVPSTSATLKTQGVRPPRGGTAEVLHTAAKKAARSNSRSDVQEYMRLRRNYV